MSGTRINAGMSSMEMDTLSHAISVLIWNEYIAYFAFQKTGLSAAVGNFLLVFQDLNPWLMLLIICYIITFFTEVTSNTAIATLMMPILSELVCSTFTFVLPSVIF